jgi:hypothetical protein
MNSSLAQLLEVLEQGLSKTASEKDEKQDEKDKDEKDNPFVKKEDKEDKDEKSDPESKKEDKSENGGQTKEASAAGAALAREVAEQIASLTLGNGMNKQASTAGQALAQALLKRASAGDMTTTDGIAPGAVPNKIQVDNAQTNAEGDASIKPMPTGDGIRNHGTVNQIFDAMIADALAQGAASTDQVHETGVAAAEGGALKAVPNQVKVASEVSAEDEIEKAAAVSELVAQGFNFEDAFEMVKQAELEINFELEKVAAMDALMAEGVDFDQAVELIKQASAGDMTTMDGIAPGVTPNKIQVDNAQMNAEGDASIKPMITGDGVRNYGSLNEIFDGIIADTKAQGAAGVDQVHETGVAAKEGNALSAVPNQIKVAAMNQLLEQGMDFDQASELVKQASAAQLLLSGPGKVGSTFSRAKTGLKGMADAAGKDAKTLLKGDVGGDSVVSVGNSGRAVTSGRGAAAGRLAKNPLVAGGAGALAAGGATAALVGREKKAALDMLMDAGLDFDSAVSLVDAKAQELYGE